MLLQAGDHTSFAGGRQAYERTVGAGSNPGERTSLGTQIGTRVKVTAFAEAPRAPAAASRIIRQLAANQALIGPELWVAEARSVKTS
jgi:hypothetical protein